MSNPRVSETLARPARTAVQGGVAFVLVEFLDAFALVGDLTERQYLALVGVLTLLVGAIQTAVENRLGAGLLRRVPPVAVPVVDEPVEDGR